MPLKLQQPLHNLKEPITVPVTTLRVKNAANIKANKKGLTMLDKSMMQLL